MQLGSKQCCGHPTMAAGPRGNDGAPRWRRSRALLRPTPNSRRTMGEDASALQLGAPRSGAPSRPAEALSPIVRWPFGGGRRRARERLRGGPPSSPGGPGPCPDTRMQWRALPRAGRSSARVTRPPYSGPVERVASNICQLRRSLIHSVKRARSPVNHTSAAATLPLLSLAPHACVCHPPAIATRTY